MDIEELTLQLAQAIEALAASERRIASLTSAVTAMRAALSEISPERFEAVYAKQYGDEELQRARQSDDYNAQLLVEVASVLRRSVSGSSPTH